LARGSDRGISKNLITALLLTVIVAAALGINLRVEASTINHWLIPSMFSTPRSIAADLPYVYFTEDANNKIGRLDSATGVFTEWTVPSVALPANYTLRVFNNNVYFTEGPNWIGRLDPSSGVFTLWQTPSLTAGVQGIYVGSEYQIYFTEFYANKIGELNPSTGGFSEWTIPTANSHPYEVTSGDAVYISGSLTLPLWFTESVGNKIGCYDLLNNVFREWSIPTPDSYPTGIGSLGGYVYFVERSAGRVGRLNPSNGVFNEWTMPRGVYAPAPYEMVMDPYGDYVYFAESGASNIGRLDPVTGVFTEWGIPAYSPNPPWLWGIDIEFSEVWFTMFNSNRIGSLLVSPVATTTASVPKTVSAMTTTNYVSTVSGTNAVTSTAMSSTTSMTSSTSSATYIYTTSRLDTVTVETPTTWTATPTGSTDDSPAIAFFDENLFAAAKGKGSNAIYLNSMDPVTLSWSGWGKLAGSTPSTPALAAEYYNLHMIVRGTDDKIYWAAMRKGESSWSVWRAIPNGKTDAAPAASVWNNTLYVAAKGLGSTSIYLNSMHLSYNCAVNPTCVWSGWKKFTGETTSSPALATNHHALQFNALYMVVRGTDNKIYWQRLDLSGSWNPSWTPCTKGSTDAAPAASSWNGRLYVTVKGVGSTTTYLNTMFEGNLSWTGWAKQPGASGETLGMATESTHLYLAALGTDSKIYWRRIT